MLWLFALYMLSGPTESAERPSSPWVYSLILRGWQTSAGQVTSSGLGLEAEVVSPELLLDFRRGPFIGRLLYQNETRFDGLRNNNTPQRMLRQDNEWGGGYFYVPRNLPFTFKFWAGYKAMEIVREDVRADSENIWRYQGWQIASTNTYEWEIFQRFVDITLTAGYAFLDTEVRQKNGLAEYPGQELIQLDPYGYHANGIFGDLMVAIQLRPRVKWFFGYKRQEYRPTREHAETTILIPGFEPRQIFIATNRFSSEGWLTGVKISF